MSFRSKEKAIERSRIKHLLQSVDYRRLLPSVYFHLEELLQSIATEGEPRRVLCAFLSAFAGEIDLRPLLEKWRSSGFVVYVPRVNGPTMEFLSLPEKWQQKLQCSELGIDEIPHGDALPYGTEGVILVPGLAFDRKGARLGRGGGFYDRFLAHEGKNLLKVGIGLSVQIQDTVVMEKVMEQHDVRMDYVCTDSGFLTCSQEGL